MKSQANITDYKDIYKLQYNRFWHYISKKSHIRRQNQNREEEEEVNASKNHILYV